MKELNIQRRYVSFFIKKATSVINNLDRDILYGKLGNNLVDTVVGIEETHIVSRRDGRGRILRGEQVWVIGAICRQTKMILLKIVKGGTKMFARSSH